MNTKVTFAGWTPDQAELNNPGMIEAKNVVPSSTGYKSFPSLRNLTGAINARCRGSVQGESKSVVYYNICGTATKLYNLLSGTLLWEDVTRSGTSSSSPMAYTTDPAATTVDEAKTRWEFILWGDTIVATNYEDVIQKAVMGTPFPKFQALGGTPPKAKHIAIIREWVVLASLQDNGGGNPAPYRVQWSGINAFETWSNTAATQSGFQDLVHDGSEIKGIVGGEHGTIFQENSVTKMTYVGSPLIFRFDTIEEARGCIASGSIQKLGSDIYYLAEDGFFKLTAGGSIPISPEKVNDWFFDNCDKSLAHRITSTIFDEKGIVMWAFPDKNAPSGTPNRVLIYKWLLDKWSWGQYDVEEFHRYSPGGSVTLEELDTLYPGGLDTEPLAESVNSISLDSNIFTGGGTKIFGAFGSDDKLSTFEGTAMSAELITSEVQISPFQRTLISAVRPLVSKGASTVQIGTRDTQSASIVWSVTTVQNVVGECPIMSNARYHRIKVNTVGDFDDAIGADVTYTEEGVF